MELEDRVQSEDLARSLIREFFLKHNYSQSLEAFEREDIRARVKMTKIDLIKLLSMERLVKTNKTRPAPLQSLLEILAEYLFSRFRERPTVSMNNHSNSKIINPSEDVFQAQQEDLFSMAATVSKPATSQFEVNHHHYQQQLQHHNSNAVKAQQMPTRSPLQARNSYQNVDHFNNSCNKTNLSAEKNHDLSNFLPTNKHQQREQPSVPQQLPLTQKMCSNIEQSDEFNVESRRGNMRKVNRNHSSVHNQNTNNTQKRPSLEQEQQDNSVLFQKNFDESSAQHLTSNTTVQSTAPSLGDNSTYGQYAAESKMLNSFDQSLNSSNTNNNYSRNDRSPDRKCNSMQIQTLQEDQQLKEQEKRFNFFGKRKVPPPTSVEGIPTIVEQESKQLKQSEFMNHQSRRRQKHNRFGDIENDFDDVLDNDRTFDQIDKPITSCNDTYVKLEFCDAGTVPASSWRTDGIPEINYTTKTHSNSAFNNNYNNHNKRISSSSADAINLSRSEIADIRKLLFNQAQNKYLPASWSQGFELSPHEPTFYGIVQKEGGPCGVLACVQAFFIKHLFFAYPKNADRINGPQQRYDFTNSTVRENCLVAALAEILYNARDVSTNTIRLAIVTNKINSSTIQQAVPIDNCGVVSFKANSLEHVYSNLQSYKSGFISTSQSSGVTTFLYSVILTRGAHTIAREMDSEENALIGHHGHCSQEQVNLFLTGRARTNCFDGQKVLDGNFKLTGIDARAQFGFLTIFEHLKYIEVGSYLKTPLFPVWIICKEYHYSVVFAKDFRCNEVESIPYFDLVYYDQLYNAEDRIRLTLTNFKYTKQPLHRTSNEEQQLNNKQYNQSHSQQQTHFLFKRKQQRNALGKLEEKEDEDTIPVIELVLRTKWGVDIEVDWNGSQPIL